MSSSPPRLPYLSNQLAVARCLSRDTFQVLPQNVTLWPYHRKEQHNIPCIKRVYILEDGMDGVPKTHLQDGL